MKQTIDDIKYLARYLTTDDVKKQTKLLIVSASIIPQEEREQLIVFDNDFFLESGYHLISNYQKLYGVKEKIDATNFNSSNFDNFDVNLVQHEVGGGEISKEQIDTIKDSPEAKSIVISGLKQDTFEYFVEAYGNQFEAISFWKNKLVTDLSPLGTLTEVKYINYFFNQKVTSLWNMSNNVSLIALDICSFSNLTKIDGIETATNLEYFAISDGVWGNVPIESLKPILKTNITYFGCGKHIIDNDLKCLAQSKITTLDMNPTQFTMEELAELLSLFPESLSGKITQPYTTGGIQNLDGSREDYYFLCKRKKTCKKGKDDARFEKYLKEFDELLKAKRAVK